MPPAYNVDIKLSFPQFDMTPGSEGRKFRRNLLLHGGKADSHGFSLADCLCCGSTRTRSSVASRSPCHLLQEHSQPPALRLRRRLANRW